MPVKTVFETEHYLRSSALPNHGKSYTVIPHGTVIDEARTQLAAAGFNIKKELYKATLTGDVAQGMYHLESGNDPEMGLMFVWSNSYNKTMAFPATYDFNYYKGDTFEFRIYPKKNDGTVFDLSQFYVPTNFANTPDDYTDTVTPYDSAQFTISTVRGSEGTPIRCFARVSDDGTFVQCAIRPAEGNQLVAGTEYVYDVEVKKPAGASGSGQYEVVQTLLTGKITITDQVTGATSATSGA